MTVRDIRLKLLSARIIQREYALAKEKANAYDMMIAAPKVVDFESKAADSTGKNAQEEKIIIALSYHERVKELEQKMIDTRKAVDNCISKLDMQAEREVITRRYLLCQSWEQIESAMGYSHTQIFRIHNKALEKMVLNGTLDL